MHDELVTGHVVHGLFAFAAVFIARWWAWMNFTWFASAHDSDDVAHRLLTLVQMAGALVLAAGVSRAVEHDNYAVTTFGFLVMRVGLVASWLRVARDCPEHRLRALRYASGLTVLQVLWLLRLALPPAASITAFIVLGLGELFVPYWAENLAGSAALFHPAHIEERYGLFTLIVLGESVLSAATGFQVALDAGGLTGGLFAVGLGGLLIAFSCWWIYFDHPGHLTPTSQQAFGGLRPRARVRLARRPRRRPPRRRRGLGRRCRGAGRFPAVAIPAAGFLLGLSTVITLTGTRLLSSRVVPKLVAAAVLVVVGLVAPTTATVVVTAAVMVLLAAAMVVTGYSRPTHSL